MARVIKTAADYQQAARDIQSLFDGMSEAVETTTAQAVADVALDCLSGSVQRAPVDKGDLRGSGYAEVNGQATAAGEKESRAGRVIPLGPPGPARDGSITAEVGFTAPYAFNQHEHLEYNHPEGGQAKYLQSVVEERRERWVADMREAAIEAFRRSLK